MVATSEWHSGNSVDARGRLWLAGLALAAAALLALAPAPAQAGTMYVHSADSGEFAGGRLTLHGVGRNVTWTTTSRRSGVVRITRAQKRLFPPRKPATGVLHIAGQRGGDELAFRLSKPRHKATRRTVSYRAKPLAKRTAAADTARSFGPASLSVVPHATVASGDDGGNDCVAGFENYTWYGMTNISSSKWDTDTWAWPSSRFLQPGYTIGNHNTIGGASQFDGAGWESDGALFEGCANHTTWALSVDPNDPGGSGTPPTDVAFDFNLEWDWTQGPEFTCSVTQFPGVPDPRFSCNFDKTSQEWNIYDSQRPATDPH